MELIRPGYEILSHIEEREVYRTLERAARTCYRSEERATEDGTSARKLVSGLVHRRHDAMLEFVDLTVLFTVDRGVSHELVRHRLASFAQESTRYCNYASKHVQFIVPPWCANLSFGIYEMVNGHVEGPDPDFWDGIYAEEHTWLHALSTCEQAYNDLIQSGWSPQQARSVLPNSLATRIVVKANLREWRHILALRTSHVAHPQMREVMLQLREMLCDALPLIFPQPQEAV